MFLSDHRIVAGQYELGGNLSPFSIRDQIVRGVELVDACIYSGELSPDPNQEGGAGRLLVVGGGVTGVAAALRAASRGLTVLLIEETGAHPDRPEDALFSRLANCKTRRIDPTLYDWPMAHWNTHHWVGGRIADYWNSFSDLNNPAPVAWEAMEPLPFWESDTPLPFTAEMAHQLVANWRHHIALARKSYPEFRLLPGTRVTAIEQHPDGFRPVLVQRVPGTDKIEFDKGFNVVFYATGPGQDRNFIPCTDRLEDDTPFYGARFWEDDDLQKGYGGREVCVAGAGDGALQDYIRVLTGEHPATVMEILDDALKHHVEWHRMQNMILAIHEAAERQYAPGLFRDRSDRDDCNNKRRDYRIAQKVHASLERCVSDLYLKFGTEISRAFNPITQQRPARLHLLVNGNAFSRCYPLNQFLVLLLSHYVRTRMGETILYETRLNSAHYANARKTKKGVKFVSKIKYFRSGLMQDAPPESEKDRITRLLMVCDNTISHEQLQTGLYFYESTYDEVVLRLGVLSVTPLYSSPPHGFDPPCGPLRTRQMPGLRSLGPL